MSDGNLTTPDDLMGRWTEEKGLLSFAQQRRRGLRSEKPKWGKIDSPYRMLNSRSWGARAWATRYLDLGGGVFFLGCTSDECLWSEAAGFPLRHGGKRFVMSTPIYEIPLHLYEPSVRLNCCCGHRRWLVYNYLVAESFRYHDRAL